MVMDVLTPGGRAHRPDFGKPPDSPRGAGQRPVGSPERAGIDLPLIAYERAMGRAGPSPEAYQQNMYMWHPLKDIRAFVEYHRTGELTFAQWLSGLIHKQHFPVFSWKDPVPTVATHAWRVSRSLRGGQRHRGEGPSREARSASSAPSCQRPRSHSAGDGAGPAAAPSP